MVEIRISTQKLLFSKAQGSNEGLGTSYGAISLSGVMTLVSVFKPVNQLDELFKDVLRQRTENSYVHDEMGMACMSVLLHFLLGRYVDKVHQNGKSCSCEFFFFVGGVLDCFQHLAL